MKKKVSAVIITKNEEVNIEDCLKSVSWVDEIVIVDSGSEDKTLEICKKFKAKIFHNPIDKGLNFNKNLGNDHASGDWILSLDADERISDGLAQEIQATLTKEGKVIGYSIARQNYFLGTWIRGAGWWPNSIIRFFKKGSAHWLDGVHELVEAKGEVSTFEYPIVHYSYRTFDDYIRKFHYYTTIRADEEISRGREITLWNSLWYFFLNPVQVILRKYFLMNGWRDGLKGLFISYSAGMVVLVMAFKMWGKKFE